MGYYVFMGLGWPMGLKPKKIINNVLSLKVGLGPLEFRVHGLLCLHGLGLAHGPKTQKIINNVLSLKVELGPLEFRVHGLGHGP